MKKIFILFFLTLFLSSCSSIKRVGEDDLLLKQNTIVVDEKKNTNSDLNELLVQKPNIKTLGLPLSLYFYNLGDKNKPNTIKEWGIKKPKTYNFIKNVFSEKQSISYANSMIGLNNWFLKNGQAPVIIKDEKITKTINNLTAYHKNNGYFRVKAQSNIEVKKNKKAIVNYTIDKGRPTFLDSIITNIKSPVLDSLYQSQKSLSFLKKGDQFKEDNFIKEASRITNLYRNNGIYHFTENDLGYYNIDSAFTNSYKTNVDLVIFDKKRVVKKNGDYELKLFDILKLRKINVYTDYSFNKKNNPYLDSINYEGITFRAHKKIKYNPRLLSESIFIRPNQVYADSTRNLTRKHLKSLRNFKITNIQYETIKDNNKQLDVNVFLTPLDKFSLDLETELTHSNIRDLGVSGKFSFINRNIFRGAEIFKLSFLSSFFNASQDANKEGSFFNSWEIGADMSLEIPRFVAPFGLGKLVPKRMSPRTMFTLGTSIQQNIGLDRETVTALIDYKWQYNDKKTIQLDVFNTQYVRNLRIGNYFDIYNSEYIKLNSIAKIFFGDPNYTLERQGETVSFMKTVFNDDEFQTSNPDQYRNNLNILDRYNIITSDFLIPTIAYSFTFNNQSDFRDNNFSFFKVRVANSGNIGGLLSNKKDSNNRKTIFNIPLAQYFKTDIEYKKFWEVNNNSVIGFRSFIGAIIPYDNSAIPFTKSYFAGGSNDIRAWQTYDLGPGSRNSGLV
jgi:hypothetical protein